MRAQMKNQGFTLVEIIIVVAVMAMLATLTSPVLIQFMQKRDAESEKLILAEIGKTLERYYLQNNSLPSDTDSDNPGGAAWYTLLANYSNLSPDQIRDDVWGTDRIYVNYKETENLLGTDVDIDYVTIHNKGVDREATASTGIPVRIVATVSEFAGLKNSSWWKNMSKPVEAFASLEAGGDDMFIKYTNRQQVMENYEVSLERLKNIASALEAYSQGKYIEAMIAYPTDSNIHKYIYYPRAEASGDTATYSLLVRNDMSTFKFGGDNRVSTSDTQEVLRRNEMIQLMRLLGLPDSTCCNALERHTNGEEKAFFYFSNPRPRVGGSCGSRPTTDTIIKLPPRITTSVDSDTCG